MHEKAGHRMPVHCPQHPLDADDGQASFGGSRICLLDLTSLLPTLEGLFELSYLRGENGRRERVHVDHERLRHRPHRLVEEWKQCPCDLVLASHEDQVETGIPAQTVEVLGDLPEQVVAGLFGMLSMPSLLQPVPAGQIGLPQFLALDEL